MTRLVYLAGPSVELDRVEAAAHVLARDGWAVTEPWWLRVREAAALGWAHDADVPADYMRESAARNYAGIVAAVKAGGLFVGLCRAEGGLSSGHAYELGVFHELVTVDRCTRVFLGGAELRGSAIACLVGDPRGHVGIWTHPTLVVATVEDALRRVE